MEREKCSELHLLQNGSSQNLRDRLDLKFEKERSERDSLAASSGLAWIWLGVHGNVPRIFNPVCIRNRDSDGV